MGKSIYFLTNNHSAIGNQFIVFLRQQEVFKVYITIERDITLESIENYRRDGILILALHKKIFVHDFASILYNRIVGVFLLNDFYLDNWIARSNLFFRAFVRDKYLQKHRLNCLILAVCQ